ncbi:MAG TPA: LCP family protein [Candidatus Dormibacteraeota bacterium]
MSRARPRARRSRYSYTTRLSRSVSVIAAVFLLGVLFGASIVVVRTVNFVHSLTGQSPTDVVKIVQQAIQPPPGSVAYKLQNNQPVNILVLGEGGQENDAPYLTDTVMAITIDPASKRLVQTSIPRDLWVSIPAWTDGRPYANKINVANEVGEWKDGELFPCCKKPEYQGRDGGGHLAESVVENVTGIHFDRYVTVDFVAFRDAVDALQGVDIHLDYPLDDCHYPDYHNGYINHGVPPGYPCPPGSGIHFPAGDLHVNGEQALEIARSRDASEPQQATDFARAKRQQVIVNAIRKKAVSLNAIVNLDSLLNAIQNNVKTDLTVNDIQALYNWGGKLPDSAFVKIALTNTDLLREYFGGGGCGDPSAYVLCPLDPSYAYIHNYLAHDLVDPTVLDEHAHMQILNATRGAADTDDRTVNSLRPFGFNLADPLPVNLRPSDHTVILDYSGGAFPATSSWLSTYFQAPVQAIAPSTPDGALQPVVPGAITDGFVVELGQDYHNRFYGLR